MILILKFSILYNTFQYYLTAKKCIDDRLMIKIDKAAMYYTKYIFVVEYASSQQLKSFNTYFKDFGSIDQNGMKEHLAINIMDR